MSIRSKSGNSSASIIEVEKWLDGQPERFEIPNSIGFRVSQEKLDEVTPELSYEHWHHIPIERVNLNGGGVRFAQGTVLKAFVRSKLRGEPNPYHPLYNPEPEHQDEHDVHNMFPIEPLFTKRDGKYYLLDGHHRLVVEHLRGVGEMEGRVYDPTEPAQREQGCRECAHCACETCRWLRGRSSNRNT